jgi:triphosphatase
LKGWSILETEIKIAFASQKMLLSVANEDWFISSLLPEPSETLQFNNVYYDTDAFLFRSLGAVVRVRNVAGVGYIHTVKAPAGNFDGLHQRYEWNFPTDSDVFDPVKFLSFAESSHDPINLLEMVIKPAMNQELHEIFRTVFERITYMDGYGNSIFEVAFDFGELVVGQKKDKICEMEIELYNGDVRDVITFGNIVLENTDSRLESRSKYARCMDLEMRSEME